MPVQIRKKIEAGRLFERAFLPGFRTLLIVSFYQSVTSDRCIRNNRNRIGRAAENIPLARSGSGPFVGRQWCIQIEVTENIIPVILPRPVISILSMNACPAARRNNITLKITLITDCSRAKLFQISRALDGFGFFPCRIQRSVGRRSPARIAIIAITTRSSIKVKFFRTIKHILPFLSISKWFRGCGASE